MLPENTPQNCLQNGWVIVSPTPVIQAHKCHQNLVAETSVQQGRSMWPCYWEHEHVTMLPGAWACDHATRSMIMWPSSWQQGLVGDGVCRWQCGDMPCCPDIYNACHLHCQQVSYHSHHGLTLPWLVFHELRLVWIPTFSPKMLNTTIYKIGDLL